MERGYTAIITDRVIYLSNIIEAEEAYRISLYIIDGIYFRKNFIKIYNSRTRDSYICNNNCNKNLRESKEKNVFGRDTFEIDDSIFQFYNLHRVTARLSRLVSRFGFFRIRGELKMVFFRFRIVYRGMITKALLFGSTFADVSTSSTRR